MPGRQRVPMPRRCSRSCRQSESRAFMLRPVGPAAARRHGHRDHSTVLPDGSHRWLRWPDITTRRTELELGVLRGGRRDISSAAPISRKPCWKGESGHEGTNAASTALDVTGGKCGRGSRRISRRDLEHQRLLAVPSGSWSVKLRSNSERPGRSRRSLKCATKRRGGITASTARSIREDSDTGISVIAFV